jgi:uncharacterized protein YcbX
MERKVTGESVVGRVGSLHRYPVKSMAGEDLAAAEIGGTGVRGDRAYALIDQESGRVVSAKRPRQWARLLEYRARLSNGVGPDGEPPSVVITCPDGTSIASNAPEVDAMLSAGLGRAVKLSSTPPNEARFEYHWPDEPGLWYQGRFHRDEVTVHAMPPGTFFDSAIVHVMTEASLLALRARVPGSKFEPGRFRPNVVIDGAGAGLDEDQWTGRVVRLGQTVRLKIVKPCLRCVMVNLDHIDVPRDPAVLRAAFAHNAGNVGLKADVLSTGTVRLGDLVSLE